MFEREGKKASSWNIFNGHASEMAEHFKVMAVPEKQAAHVYEHSNHRRNELYKKRQCGFPEGKALHGTCASLRSGTMLTMSVVRFARWPMCLMIGGAEV